jgi:LPS O-antigen subunit length determinant protein (WzzB/FepE family)
VPRAIQEPSTKKLLRIQTSKDSTPLFESKFSKTTSQEIPNSPKSANSSKTLPQNLTSSSKHSKIKTSDTPRSAVLSISFSSPTNEELNKKLHQVNKNLEKLHHGFSQEKFFPS